MEPHDHEMPGAGTLTRWPLSWRGLLPRERWQWFDRLWTDVCELQERYRLQVAHLWWEDDRQVEALAAFPAWAWRYDSGEWDDPPGKLALLYETDQLNALLRDKNHRFEPAEDRFAFTLFIVQDRGCRPPLDELGA